MVDLIEPIELHLGGRQCTVEDGAVTACLAYANQRMPGEISQVRVLAVASGWSRRQASTNGSSIKGVKFGRRARHGNVNAEFDLTVRHSVQTFVCRQIENPKSNAWELFIKTIAQPWEKIKRSSRDRGDRHLRAMATAQIADRQDGILEFIHNLRTSGRSSRPTWVGARVSRGSFDELYADRLSNPLIRLESAGCDRFSCRAAH